MSIILDWKGKQIPYFPEKKDQILEIPYRKNSKIGEEIIIDKILEKDGKTGQPYLPIKLIGKVVNPRVVNKKIGGMKYQAKKRHKKTWGHQEKHTLIEIIAVEGS